MAAVSVAAGFAAFFSAAACCVIPAALALAGMSAGGLSFVVPYHWPLTVTSGMVVALGWALHVWKRGTSRATFWLLTAATVFVLLSVVWKAFFEAPLQAWLLSL